MSKFKNGKLKIAGEYTVDDWAAMEDILEVGSTREMWKFAFKVFFQTRLEERYFKPIRLLQKHGENTGEGFAIVALQCSLIEFLASTLEGTSYRHEKDARKDYEYGPGESQNIFKHFLLTIPPFNDHFSDTQAGDFYKNVRCALLHEARTKNHWRILAGCEGDPVITFEDNDKIIYRNNLQKLFEEYVKCYGKKLLTCKAMQKAFIRKFDFLCCE